jgi:outer membrane receptor protein involved in Fe transport
MIIMKEKKIQVTLLLAALALNAQANDVFTDDSSRVQNLDEVIVVAQPKETAALRLQPLSSSVLTSYEMRKLQIHDLGQLSDFVPSFQMPQYGSRLTSSIYVRGIGSRIENPSVGVYYDNIPLLSKAAFNHHFYMIDRVDVLRGPQSTLYGQNAEGGLVRIYSKNPMNYQGTDIRLGIGTGLWRNVEVAHHHRPSDRLAFTVAGFYSGLKGFIDNQNFSDKNDKSLEAGAKLRLIYAPTQKLTFDLTGDYQWVNQNGFGYGEFQPIESSSVSPYSLDVQDPATTIMNGYRRNMVNSGLTVSYQMPRLLFTSTTSYQFLQDRMKMDQDYMTPDFLQLVQRQKQNAITQEFVLRSRGQQTWQHASGLFGAYQWLHTDAPVCFGDAITGPIGSAITNAMKSAMLQSMVAQMKQQMMERGMPEAAAEAAAQKAAEAAIEKAGITMSA